MRENAVILAAGYGSRLGNLTNIIPKSLIPVGSTTIIDRLLDVLIEYNFKNIYIITGFGEKLLKKHLKKRILKEEVSRNIQFIFNDHYGDMNNFYSLYLMKNYIKNDFVLINSDLVFDKNIFDIFVKNVGGKYSTFMIDEEKILGHEEMKVNYSENSLIAQFGKYLSPENANGEYIGLCYLKFDFFEKYVNECIKLLNNNDHNNYYEDVFSKQIISDLAGCVGISTQGKFWQEIDTKKDLKNIWKNISLIEK